MESITSTGSPRRTPARRKEASRRHLAPLTVLSACLCLSLLSACEAPLPPLEAVDLSAYPPALAERLQGEMDAAQARDADANRQLGLRLAAYEHHRAAATSFTRAALISPEARHDYLAGSAWLAAGEGALALDAFARSNTQQASARATTGEGAAHELLGERPAAIAKFEAALAQDEDAAYALWRLGQLHLEDGDPRRALPYLQRVLSTHGDVGAVHYALSQVHARLGDDAKAQQHQQAFITHRERQLRRDSALARQLAGYVLSDRAAIARGQQLFAANKLPEAVAAFEQALAINPNNASTHTTLIGVHTALRQVEDAKRHFEAATRLAPGQARAYFNYGRALANAGRWQEAATLVEEAVRLQPHTVEYRLVYGSTLGATDRLAEAAAQFRAVADGDTDHALAHTNLVRVLGAMEDDEAVLALIEKGRAGSRPLLPMLLAHAQTLAGRPDPQTAIPWLREALNTPQVTADAALAGRIEARIDVIEALATEGTR
ncbi:MAG: tetratricopeptide repeat protein [Pseudomonadota bacterium]